MTTVEKIIRALSDGQKHGVAELAALTEVSEATVEKHLQSLVLRDPRYNLYRQQAWVEAADVAYAQVIERAEKVLDDYPESCPERKKIIEFIDGIKQKRGAL